MRFCALQATFGALERQSLELSPGLNIIEAPNESGKSTLCAFLRVMLYGLSTHERGALADKNRYAPRSGSAMQGVLALECEGLGAVTLRRETVRSGMPMAAFSATFTGTNEPVGLTAADCGETLLGVPRAVYERSAFIRQSGLAVSQDAELEKRIASLITTLEEDVSYTEAAAALRRALNARRSNSRSGQIPVLERAIGERETALSELRALHAQRLDVEAELRALDEDEQRIREGLRAHELADRREARLERERAAREADEADARTEVLYRMITGAKTPDKSALESSRARLSALDELDAKRADAATQRETAEAALDALGSEPSEHQAPGPALPIAAAALACAAAALCFLLKAAYPLLLLLPAALLLIPFFRRRAERKRAALAYEQERAAREAALREADAALDALEAVYEGQLALALEGIPAADRARASAFVEENLARYALLDQLEHEAHEKRLRCELLGSETGELPDEPAERPERSRAELEAALAALSPRRTELRRLRDTGEGRERAIGDAAELEAELAGMRDRLETLRGEYDSLLLASEALERANATLASRFSPLLGRRTAELFAALTGGKYAEVLLDRSFRARVAETDEAPAYDASLLSQGAADQLYLAVRLAICELVLPKPIPLVLDDALINFDDERCRSALELLLRESETRQVLLLTCQRREADYLRGRSGVQLLSL